MRGCLAFQNKFKRPHEEAEGHNKLCPRSDAKVYQIKMATMAEKNWHVPRWRVDS